MSFLEFLLGKKRKRFRLGLPRQDKVIVQQKWAEIQELIKLGGPSRFKTAILEADKLLNFVLEKMGYQGNLGEKLKMAKDKFIDGSDYSIYNEIWEAHKCRNRIVHEVEYTPLSHEAHDVVRKYEKGLRKLGVL